MTGHVNGSDLLVFMDNNAIGHCTTHTATFSTETKDVAEARRRLRPGDVLRFPWDGKEGKGKAPESTPERMREMVRRFASAAGPVPEAGGAVMTSGHESRNDDESARQHEGEQSGGHDGQTTDIHQ